MKMLVWFGPESVIAALVMVYMIGRDNLVWLR